MSISLCDRDTGPKTAVDLFDKQGITSLAELVAKYPTRYNMEYHRDINLTMTRKEVENIAEYIRIQVRKVDPDAHIVICGGYRRGKGESSIRSKLRSQLTHELP